MKWENAELSLIAEIGDGAHASLKRVKSGIPYLTAKNITKNGISYSNIDFISEETYEKYFKEKSNALTKPQKNDILYSIIGSIGGVYCVKDEKIGISSSVAIIRANSELIFPQYLAYFLKSKFFEAQVQAIKGGVAQGFMSIEKLKNVNILYPKNLDYQAKIVSILSAYDDLIENNQKQIKLLEEAAQRLYKEWFVDLHFPGYKTTPIIDGVPEGWTKKSVENSLEMYIGGGWGKEIPTGNNVIAGKVIRGTDINDIKAGNFKDVPLRYHTKNDINKRNLQKYDIVFELSNGNINNIGRSILIDDFILEKCGENTICASFCKLFRPLDKVHSLILYCEIQDMQNSGRMLPFKKQGSNGINNFAFEEFLNHEFLVPNDEKFIKPIDNIINLISILQNQVSELIEARDRLIPKLMSGELEV